MVADGSVENDATLELLARTAVSHARAGADIVAPSDMMDGRVGAIRAELDGDRLHGTPILAYARKVRVGVLRAVPRGGRRALRRSVTAAATRWTPRTGGRRCARSQLDIDEGADMIMVKPALAYLDVIAAIKCDDATARCSPTT